MTIFIEVLICLVWIWIFVEALPIANLNYYREENIQKEKEIYRKIKERGHDEVKKPRELDDY